MILLRTEHDRPAVFIEHLSHYARLSVKTLKSCTVLADIQWTLDSGGIGRRLDVRINPIRFQGHGVMGSSTLIRSRAEVQFDRTPGDRNFIHIACKSQSIHCVELNPYPLRRNDRDRRCRSEARRFEHSLVCERSGVRILPLRWCRADVILYALCGRVQRVWSEVSAHMPA